MKIVIVGPVYPYRGGIAQYTGLMSQNLAKKNEVVNVSFKLQYPRFMYHHEQKDYSNDTFKVTDVHYWLNTINPFSWISTAHRINILKPDLVLIQWWHPFFAPAYWSMLKLLKRKIRVLFCCHNVLPHEGFPCKKLLARMVLRRGNGFIVHSAQDEQELHTLVRASNVRHVVHPTYNVFRLLGIGKEEARRQLHLPEDKEVLLFFGFIRKYKGLKHLLNAMPIILKAHPNAHLLVVGEFFEGDRDDYMALISRNGITADTMTLVDGYLPDKEVEPYFAASDLVVLPYESATQSGIVQIAYGFEKPVVATEVGGLPEVVLHGKTGFVVPPLNDDALAAAVIRFFEEKKAEDFEKGIRQEAYRYSWDRMNETIEQLYRNCNNDCKSSNK